MEAKAYRFDLLGLTPFLVERALAGRNGLSLLRKMVNNDAHKRFILPILHSDGGSGDDEPFKAADEAREAINDDLIAEESLYLFARSLDAQRRVDRETIEELRSQLGEATGKLDELQTKHRGTRATLVSVTQNLLGISHQLALWLFGWAKESGHPLFQLSNRLYLIEIISPLPGETKTQKRYMIIYVDRFCRVWKILVPTTKGCSGIHSAQRVKDRIQRIADLISDAKVAGDRELLLKAYYAGNLIGFVDRSLNFEISAEDDVQLASVASRLQFEATPGLRPTTIEFNSTSKAARKIPGQRYLIHDLGSLKNYKMPDLEGLEIKTITSP